MSHKSVINVGSYRVGIYTRESRDDNGEKYETIETQRDLLIDFVKNSKFGEVIKVYVDNNVSGSLFVRSGMDELKSDIECGNINLLVLKDLSRLGRNNAKTLLFLDYLEECNVRVITFDGRYDSTKDNDTVGIDTWYNERYVRDISKKIRANLRFKIERGEYIGHAPFGYKKSTEIKNKLIIDEEKAYIVREIYELYLKKGLGYSAIAKYLNNTGKISPALTLWNATAIRRILTNRVYMGDTVQGISEKVSFKSKKTRRLSKDRWVITENTHDAIINRDEFFEAQTVREGKDCKGGHRGELHVLRGIMFCGNCGANMYARVRRDRPIGYVCGNYCKKGKSECSSHFVREKTITDMLIVEILNLLKREDVMGALEKKFDERSFNAEKSKAHINSLKEQVVKKQRQQEVLYMDRLSGRVSESLFERMNALIESNITKLNSEIEKISSKTERSKTFGFEAVLGKVRQAILKSGLNNEIVKLLVNKIIINNL